MDPETYVVIRKLETSVAEALERIEALERQMDRVKPKEPAPRLVVLERGAGWMKTHQRLRPFSDLDSTTSRPTMTEYMIRDEILAELAKTEGPDDA